MARTFLTGITLPPGAAAGPPNGGAGGTPGQKAVDVNGVEWTCIAPGTWLEGVSRAAAALASRLLVYGHSYTQAGGTTHPDKQYVDSLGGLLRSDLVDLGVGGSLAGLDTLWPSLTGSNRGWGGWAWVLQQLQPTRKNAPYAPVGHLCLIHFGHNDLAQHAHDVTGTPRAVWKSAMRTIVSRCVTARLLEDTDASVAYGGTGGTWAAAVPDTTKNSGAGYRPFPGNGATVTITIPSDFEGGWIALGFIAWPSGDGQVTFTGTTSALPSTLSLAGQTYATGGANAQRSSSLGLVARVKLTAADAGKTIVATYGSGAGTQVASPAAPTVTTQTPGTGGTYQYQLVWLHANGETTPGPSSTAVTNGTTLTGTAYNVITVPAFPTGVVAARVLRVTATGATGNSAQLGQMNAPAPGTATVGKDALGLAIVTSAGTVYDQGALAPAYTAAVQNPLAGGGAFDYWQIEAVNPTQRAIVVGLNRIPDAGYVNGAGDADVANYNADLQAVIAEFPDNPILWVDADGALAKTAAYFAPDNIHPNDRGHAILAAKVLAALDAWSAVPLVEVAHSSRVSKRPTSRNLITRQFPIGQDYTLGAAWAAVDAAGNLTAVISAQAGDDIEVTLAGMWSTQGVGSALDLAVVDSSGNVIRYASANLSTPTTPGAQGWPAWHVAAAQTYVVALAGACTVTVQPGDLTVWNSVPGVVMLRLDGIGSGKVLFAGGTSASPPLQLHARNLGRRNTPGFNAS